MKRLVGPGLLLSMLVVAHLSTTALAAEEETIGPVGTITIVLEKSVHFDTLDGNRIVVQPGRYVVEAVSSSGLRLVPQSPRPDVLIAAQSRPEAPTVSEPTAVAVPWQEDEFHIVLLQPAGSALEAIGSFSGVRGRADAVLVPTAQLQQKMQLGQAISRAQMTVVPPVDPLTAPPTSGWQYYTLFPSDFHTVHIYNQVQGDATGGTTEIPNPPARITMSGLTWAVGDDALAAIHLPDGARMQQVTCVFNEAPFQAKDGHGQVTTVPLGLAVQIRKQKFGDPVNASAQQLVYGSLPNAIRTGVTVLQVLAPPNQVQQIQNFQSFYVLYFSRLYQGIVPAFSVPPVELRGCRIGYTVQ